MLESFDTRSLMTFEHGVSPCDWARRAGFSLCLSVWAVGGCRAYEPGLLATGQGASRGGSPAAPDRDAAADADRPELRDARADAAPGDAGAMDAVRDSGLDAQAAQDAAAACDDAGDCCLDDPDKLEPGVCGCGVADVDRDGDGSPDCVDGCPDDRDKTAPGSCGCGLVDSDSTSATSCVGLRDALVHRYSFEQAGGVASDTRGSADGVVVHTSLDGEGALVLSGGDSDQYLALPGGILSALTDASIELWVSWQGGAPQQRLFDFGLSEPPMPANACTGNGAQYFDGGFYYFCGDLLSWNGAKTNCEGGGGSLLAIESDAEQSFIAGNSEFAAQSWWFGANDRVTEGEWHFARGSDDAGPVFWRGKGNGSAPEGVYTHWYSGRPDDFGSGEDCGNIRSDGFWDDGSCIGARPFICEMRGLQGAASESEFAFSPADTNGMPRVSFLPDAAGGPTVDAAAVEAFPTDGPTQVVVVFDDTNDRVVLYVGGSAQVTQATDSALSSLRDADNWIGRSRITGDPGFAGTIDELRIYDTALSPDQVAVSMQAGPDPWFLAQ